MTEPRYDNRLGWLNLQAALIAALPAEADIELRHDKERGFSALVHKQQGTADYLCLHMFSGIGGDWKTLFLADVQGTIGTYRDMHEAAEVANKWVLGRKVKRIRVWQPGI